MSPTISPYYLPRLVAGFVKQHSLIDLQLKEECATTLLDWLRAETVDLAIIPLPVSTEGMSVSGLMEERLFAIVNKDHPLQEEGKVTLNQLSDSSLLLLKDIHCSCGDALPALAPGIVQPRVIFESGCFLMIFNMVKEDWAYPSCRRCRSMRMLVVNSFLSRVKRPPEQSHWWNCKDAIKLGLIECSRTSCTLIPGKMLLRSYLSGYISTGNSWRAVLVTALGNPTIELAQGIFFKRNLSRWLNPGMRISPPAS